MKVGVKETVEDLAKAKETGKATEKARVMGLDPAELRRL
jgi:hypothetical protein